MTITADPSGLLEIVTIGNTEITSAKTIINNDVDIIGSLNVSIKIDCPDINATDGAAGGSLTVRNKEMHDHRHSQSVDSDGDSELDGEIEADGEIDADGLMLGLPTSVTVYSSPSQAPAMS